MTYAVWVAMIAAGVWWFAFDWKRRSRASSDQDERLPNTVWYPPFLSAAILVLAGIAGMVASARTGAGDDAPVPVQFTNPCEYTVVVEADLASSPPRSVRFDLPPRTTQLPVTTGDRAFLLLSSGGREELPIISSGSAAVGLSLVPSDLCDRAMTP